MSIQQLALFTPELSKEEQHFNHSLHHALHNMCDASKRWAMRQTQGMSDQDLRKAIAYEFGIMGGFHSSEFKISYEGGKKPKLWVDICTSEKPSLQGQALVTAVRNYMKIPYPG